MYMYTDDDSAESAAHLSCTSHTIIYTPLRSVYCIWKVYHWYHIITEEYIIVGTTQKSREVMTSKNLKRSPKVAERVCKLHLFRQLPKFLSVRNFFIIYLFTLADKCTRTEKSVRACVAFRDYYPFSDPIMKMLGRYKEA